ncbi:DegT/DnrJ/EryC1/StrS family aminotransferase [Pseudomonas sp. B329]|nr:DegT/DnrJ/EryC1/StrS family aminotransferase [Pseudomonas sp. B329]
MNHSFSSALPLLEEGLDAFLDQSGWVNDKQVRLLEQAIEVYTGAPFAIATGNATDSLIISLMALGIGPGDEVIVPCYSFFASLSCVLHVGATPVFVDIEPGGYGLDCALVEAAITLRTKAIMPVHLFRQMVDMQALKVIAQQHRLWVIEDSAEGIGMRWDGEHAGLIGDIGVLSFFPTKTLGALGDAGMILTRDPLLASRVRQIMDNGRDAAGLAQCLGYNSRMDDVQALWLRARMLELEPDIARRAAHCAAYDEYLEPLKQWVQRPVTLARDCLQRTVNYVYLIEVPQRDALAAFLTARHIGTEAYYPLPLHLQPVCEYLDYQSGDFPVAERASTRALGLPLYPDLTPASIGLVCTAIGEFYAAQGTAQ